MASLSFLEKFRFEKQPAKRFRLNSDEDKETQDQNSAEIKSEEPHDESRNSFDCLLKLGCKPPDRSSVSRDISINCVPEMPTYLQPSPAHSPVFSGHVTETRTRKASCVDSSQADSDATCIPESQSSLPDSTTSSIVNGDGIKRGVKRRFPLKSESESDAELDGPPKSTSPVFSGLSNHHSVPNSKSKHTCSSENSTKKKEVECIDVLSDSESDDNKPKESSGAYEPGTSSDWLCSPSPGKRSTAKMGYSQSPIHAAQRKPYRRIMSLEDSYDDSDKTQLGDDQEALVSNLVKRFPKRTRADLINVLIGLEWSLSDAIQTLNDADYSAEESDDDDSSNYSGSDNKWDDYSKSGRDDSSRWLSKTNHTDNDKRNNREHIRDNDSVDSWLSNDSESSRGSTEQKSGRHTCGKAPDRHRKQRSVAIPEEYQQSPVKSVKHTCRRRRIKQMASSSEDEEEDDVESGNRVAKQQTQDGAVIVLDSGEEAECNDDVSSETNSRIKTPIEYDEEDDDEDNNDQEDYIYDDDTSTLHKLMLSFFNDATLEELIGIDSCSKSKAQKIIAMRPFVTFEVLLTRMEETKGLGKDIVWNSSGIFQEREVVVFLMNKCARIAERIHGIISSQLDGDMKAQITKEPSTIEEAYKLKPYQLIGLNWLALLHKEGVNGILADEMGLGKTVQTIAFLAHLLEQGNSGPHVIVVPSSTLDNWARELMKWCPALEVLMYSGSQPYRQQLRDDILYGEVPFNVIVTTYNICSSTAEDRSMFRKLPIEYAIFDEGHMLKNMNSSRYQHLMKIKAKRRLLLTGTPLQNNLLELISLLSFVMPDIFMNKASELKKIFGFKKLKSNGMNTEQSSFEEERIAHAKRIMQPFMLRRIKTEVLKQLPVKKERIEYVEMTADQQQRYDALKASLSRAIKNDQDKKSKNVSSALMELRKMSNHPLLHRHHYNDDKLKEMAHLMLKEPTHYDANPVLIQEDMTVMTDYELHRLCQEFSVLSPYQLNTELIMASGKFQMLDKLLPPLKEEGSRVLLFSQFVMVLDIVEPYMKQRGYKFLRLDGQTQVSDRLELIDKFTSTPDIFIFLLSTRAGGLGINLTAANTVIIHDIDYNPYNDKQAEDRCHRLGQTRDVDVIRLISKHTVEEAMLKCAQYKLQLERKMTSNNQENKDDTADVASMLREALEL